MKKAAIILVVLIAAVSGAYAQKPAVVTENEAGWTKIGEITASFKMQNESIVVLGADEFDAIKLKVTDAPINIERLQVFYESGDMEEIEVKSPLNIGDETRVINLEKPDRDIQKVAFTYKTMPNYQGEKAHVELHGLKTRKHTDGDKYREEKNEVEEDAEEAREEIREEAKQAEEEGEEAGQTVGQAISEAAAKVEANITDDVYEGKYGPDGQRVFIQDDGTYYYINDKGDKVKITKLEMRDHKPKKDNDNK